jgi:steroid delta-isomerase-like uncharacterized protein
MGASVVEINKRSLAAMDAGDLEGLLELYADDMVFADNGQELGGKDEFRATFASIFATYTDIRTETVWSIATDDRIAAEYRISLVHSGEYETPDGTVIPASGQRLTLTVIGMQRIRDGLIVEERHAADSAAWFPATA